MSEPGTLPTCQHLESPEHHRFTVKTLELPQDERKCLQLTQGVEPRLAEEGSWHHRAGLGRAEPGDPDGVWSPEAWTVYYSYKAGKRRLSSPSI